MYDIYSKALAVLEVLEWAQRRIEGNKPFRLVSKLRREGLYLDKSVAYLIDSLRHTEALRFRNAMATVESHFARLCREDREFIRVEGPATTGFYLAYLDDHERIVGLARKMLVGERRFPGESRELVDVASVLVTSPNWVVKVLMAEIDPRHRAMLEPRVCMMLDSALSVTEGKPVPEAYVAQMYNLRRSVSSDLMTA
jgi:hypothetical protein